MRSNVLIGCIISAALVPATIFAETPKPTFAKDIAPILLRPVCHMPQAWRGGADVAYVVQRCAGRGPERSSSRLPLARCHLGTPRENLANGVTIGA